MFKTQTSAIPILPYNRRWKIEIEIDYDKNFNGQTVGVLIQEALNAGEYLDRTIIKKIELVNNNDQNPQWVGCGECDCSFPCFDGKEKCIRLPKKK